MAVAVKLVPKFTKAQITQMLERRVDLIERAILSSLQRVAEKFVAAARETRTYKDRTGNLRSSIGYVIMKNGRQIDQNFQAFPAGASDDESGSSKKKKSQGKTEAKSVIEKLKVNFPRGYVLIVVAGMEYAAAVESRGYDVITASSIQAEVDLKTALASIKQKALNIA